MSRENWGFLAKKTLISRKIPFNNSKAIEIVDENVKSPQEGYWQRYEVGEIYWGNERSETTVIV